MMRLVGVDMIQIACSLSTYDPCTSRGPLEMVEHFALYVIVPGPLYREDYGTRSGGAVEVSVC